MIKQQRQDECKLHVQYDGFLQLYTSKFEKSTKIFEMVPMANGSVSDIEINLWQLIPHTSN